MKDMKPRGRVGSARPVLLVWMLALVCFLLPRETWAQRVALLVGNAQYAVGPLRQPPADVAHLEAALRTLGFTVRVQLDLAQQPMRRAIREFGQQAKDADVALFYYSGHAAQVAGENFLIPLGAEIQADLDFEVEAVSVNAVLRMLELARPKASIVILDACRDNPLTARGRTGTKGLARMEAPGGSLIAFATAPNATAADNGHYARILSAELRKPGQEIVDVFRNTTAEVMRLSQGKQEPRVSEVTLRGRLYLAGEPVLAPSARDYAGYDKVFSGAQMLRMRLQSTNIDQIQRDADRGDLESIYLVAVARWTGEGLKQDTVEARKLMRQAAKAGFPRAAFAFGNMLADGVGGSANEEEALEWWTAGAKAGFGPSAVRLARHHAFANKPVPQRNFAAALHFATQAESLGQPDGLSLLGFLYRQGWGVPKDVNKGNALLDQAVNKGSANAMQQVAAMHRWGDGRPMDKARAYKLYRQAGELGDADALAEAAEMLKNGELGEPRAEDAAPLFLLAAQQGSPKALDQALQLILQGKLPKPPSWDLQDKLKTAVEQNHPVAFVGWVHGLASGAGGQPPNPKLAAQWARWGYSQILKAPIDSEAAYPPNARRVAQLVINGLRSGDLTPQSPDELPSLVARWSDTPPMDLKVKIQCGTTPHDMTWQIWNATGKDEPAEAMAKWLKEARGCTVPEDAMASFSKLYQYALSIKKPYVSVVKAALDARDAATKPSAAASR